MRFLGGVQVADDGPRVSERLFELMRKVPVGGKQVHDANIVATMLVYGISALLTDNVRDFERFAPWIEVRALT